SSFLWVAYRAHHALNFIRGLLGAHGHQRRNRDVDRGTDNTDGEWGDTHYPVLRRVREGVGIRNKEPAQVHEDIADGEQCPRYHAGNRPFAVDAAGEDTQYQRREDRRSRHAEGESYCLRRKAGWVESQVGGYQDRTDHGNPC